MQTPIVRHLKVLKQINYTQTLLKTGTNTRHYNIKHRFGQNSQDIKSTHKGWTLTASEAGYINSQCVVFFVESINIKIISPVS